MIPTAVLNGADRIELCDNLAVGGTTVSKGVLEEATRYLHEKNIPVMVMIRPRGGNFVYNDIELKIMENDIFTAQQAGADGVVFGCLTPANDLDEEAMEMLIGATGGMQITMHMAFDEMTPSQQTKAIEWLSTHSVDRILSHGGPLTKSINETLPRLQELVTLTKGKITLLPGGGINADNAATIAKTIGVKELHGTKIVGA